jgi:predicted Kef-type K+ transport protein
LSSTAIVLQTLEERGLRQGPVGQSAFGVLLFQDLAVIPLFAVLPLLAVAGAGAPAKRKRTRRACSPARRPGRRRWRCWPPSRRW